MSTIPESCQVAFKEWQGVCHALLAGRQTLIVRKGGIDEGPGGFAPEHRSFWLYPTQIHQAQQGLREFTHSHRVGSVGSGDRVSIEGLVEVELIRRVTSEGQLSRLEPFHVWTDETIRKRFHYREPGLWVLAVRVYRREPPATLDVTTEQGGCKTWVPLDPPLSTTGIRPVIGEAEWADRRSLMASLFQEET